MANYVLYGSPLSPFVRKAEAVLKSTGQDYEIENINIMDMPDWFLEISPARRIPVLRDRSIGEEGIPGTIADSSAICLFLDRKHESGLYGGTAFETGRIAWLEEYADTELAMNVGMNIFRPILFPLMAGKESDLETARKGFNEKLPPRLDYLESALDGQDFFVGGRLSLADIAVATQLCNLDLVAGLPDRSRWPGIVKHAETMMQHKVFEASVETGRKMLANILPEKPDLT
ncbi:MAG: glutathione S-transferase family protein [Parvularculales bacterium]